jgi:nicotinic acid mononucleotide adenylyltransferase
LSGAFNPLHDGHRGLADVAGRLLGLAVAFELSVANVDKPPLAEAEVRRRLAPFVEQAPVWLSRAPRFVDKAALFPGAVFVVGADTALRLVDTRYYDGDAAQVHNALAKIRDHRCTFLVACRVDAFGQCVELVDVPLPSDFRSLFGAIPATVFRLDVSSTQIRNRRAGSSAGA